MEKCSDWGRCFFHLLSWLKSLRQRPGSLSQLSRYLGWEARPDTGRMKKEACKWQTDLAGSFAWTETLPKNYNHPPLCFFRLPPPHQHLLHLYSHLDQILLSDSGFLSPMRPRHEALQLVWLASPLSSPGHGRWLFLNTCPLLYPYAWRTLGDAWLAGTASSFSFSASPCSFTWISVP